MYFKEPLCSAPRVCWVQYRFSNIKQLRLLGAAWSGRNLRVAAIPTSCNLSCCWRLHYFTAYVYVYTDFFTVLTVLKIVRWFRIAGFLFSVQLWHNLLGYRFDYRLFPESKITVGNTAKQHFFPPLLTIFCDLAMFLFRNDGTETLWRLFFLQKWSPAVTGTPDLMRDLKWWIQNNRWPNSIWKIHLVYIQLLQIHPVLMSVSCTFRPNYIQHLHTYRRWQHRAPYVGHFPMSFVSALHCLSMWAACSRIDHET